MSYSRLAAGWLLSLLVGCPGPGAAAADFDGIDVYGMIRVEFVHELADWRAADAAGDSVRSRAARERIVSALRQRGDFALVEATLISYFRKDPAAKYLTIDVVERGDRERRMPFVAAPQGEIGDPEHLIDLWREYETKALSHLRSGASSAQPCEVLHCLLPFKPYADLFPYLALFDTKVPRNAALLYQMAAQDASAVERGSALYLLAHSEDVARLLPALAQKIYDPSSFVRNNALRMLWQIAQREPQRPFPIDDLVDAMDFAIATDRNKATLTLAKLVHSRHRERIAQLALPTALRLLRLEQPINHEPALEILRGISAQDFGERDYEAWERWVAGRMQAHRSRQQSR
jgi:hypothetical protein